MKNCPNCGSDRLYRKNPQSLIIHCQGCKSTLKAKQSLKPLRVEHTYVRRYKLKFKVSIWYCPVDTDYYSFAASCQGGMSPMNEFEDDPYLKGKYESVDHAVYAGISWANE